MVVDVHLKTNVFHEICAEYRVFCVGYDGYPLESLLETRICGEKLLPIAGDG